MLFITKATHIIIIDSHNREDFWEIPESIIGKFLSIIDTGLYSTDMTSYWYSDNTYARI